MLVLLLSTQSRSYFHRDSPPLHRDNYSFISFEGKRSNILIYYRLVENVPHFKKLSSFNYIRKMEIMYSPAGNKLLIQQTEHFSLLLLLFHKHTHCQLIADTAVRIARASEHVLHLFHVLKRGLYAFGSQNNVLANSFRITRN